MVCGYPLPWRRRRRDHANYGRCTAGHILAVRKKLGASKIRNPSSSCPRTGRSQSSIDTLWSHHHKLPKNPLVGFLGDRKDDQYENMAVRQGLAHRLPKPGGQRNKDRQSTLPQGQGKPELNVVYLIWPCQQYLDIYLRRPRRSREDLGPRLVSSMCVGYHQGGHYVSDLTKGLHRLVDQIG